VVAAMAEGLESRRLLSAVVVPVLHGINLSAAQRVSAAAGGVAASAIYGALTSLGKSTKAAPVAVAAKALSPFSLNWQGIKQTLGGAPLETSLAAASKAIIVPIPMPDGTMSRFKVVEAPIMELGLANQFPDIKTYRGLGIDDTTARIRLDYTPLGFHAQVLSVSGSYYIDPYFRNDAAGTYASYYKRDMVAPDVWKCEVVENGATPLSAKGEAALDGIFADSLATGATTNALAFGTQLKTYRLAVAADGEYVAAVGGGTVAGGQAAVVTAVNRVTGVYETELGVRLVLVANNSSLIYTNASTDPYTNTNPSTLLSQNQSNIDSVIGNANYDIGHVFTTGGGGLAALGVVGLTGQKAKGETGLSNPTGDAYYIDYVAHEMGHEFGANHTFNTANDTSNRNAATAYEPGSGSTIMAYAGIEGSEDLQAHSDPFFHSASIDEIRSYITTGTIANVGTTSSTGNNPPTVSAGSAYTIPTGTPFILTATGSDLDGDTLTYEWQERDLGVARLLTDADNGTSPILRDWVPTTSPSRTVPRLSNLLSNTPAPGEKLPAVARSSFKWRVIARDNRSGGGGVSSSDVTLSVVNTGGAFSVTAPNTAVSWFANQNQTVTWNVAGTTANGINTANVSILLSTDSGNTYPITLAASTANDGSQTIVVPASLNTSTARIEIAAVGNIFFDISNVNFTISDGIVPPGGISGEIDEDRNADGAINGGDVPLNGVVVYLDNNNNGILDGVEPNTTTAGTGDYSFSNLDAGTYHVRQQLQGNYLATSPVSGGVDVSVVGGSVSTAPTLLDFPLVYTGTSSADNYLVRLSTPGASVSTFYADNFNRATLAGGTNVYTTSITAGNGGASVTGSDLLTLTNDSSAAANGSGAVYVTTPTSAFSGFNPQLHSNAGMLTWTLNIRQMRTNPSGFASGNYGAAFILGGSNAVFNGSGAGNGYAVAIGNGGTPDPIRLVKFSGGMGGTLTTLAQDAAQNVSNHYWSVKVTYDPATNQWNLFTRDDGASAFTNPSNGVTTQAGSSVIDSTYTSTALTHTGAYWAYSTAANQTAQFDNLSLTSGGTSGPQQLEILVNGVVTYTAAPNLPSSLAFNLGNGDDIFTLDSGNGAVAVPVSFAGQGGVDTYRFVGGINTISTDASAFAEKIELSSSASVTFGANQTLTALTVDSSSRAVLSVDGSRMLRVDSLTLAGGGILDLNDNDLVVNSGSFSAIRSLVFNGYSGTPDTSKTGIISTTGQNSGDTILALFDNAFFGASEWPPGSGNSIPAGAIVGKYTYFGDTDFDGQVTPQDYTAIDANLGATNVNPGEGWFLGDTDFDGNITPQDYTAIDANLGLGVGAPLAAAGASQAIIVPSAALPRVSRRSLWDELNA
jgi:hypothetical protein